jgi:hypothetical protein
METAQEVERARAGAAFYSVSNESYFLGAVGLINSLRIVGHTEPVFLLDCGLSAEQRELLAPQVTLVPGPSDAAPHLLKSIAPRRHPAESMVLIDADMIVTRRLTDPIDTASRGYVVAGATGMDRFLPEWGELLDLGRVERRPYVSTGLVFLGGASGREVIRLMDERKERVDFDLTFWRRNIRDYPLLHADQDLLNAIFASRVGADRIVAFDGRLSASPPFTGLRVLDERSLRCAYADGSEPYVVHHWLAKPWLERTYHGAYSRLLKRLLVDSDLAVRVPDRMIPLRFRRGLRASIERKRINAGQLLRMYVGKPVAARIGGRARPLAAKGSDP